MTGVTPQAGPGHSGQAPEPCGLGHSASVPNALPIIAKLHEQVGTGHYYDDGFAMVGSDGSFESRPSTQAMRPANRDGSEAAALITELYEALETAAKRFRDYEQIHRLKGTTEGYLKADNNADLAIYCEAALAKARGDQ